jgi:hypothetical protein
LLLNAKQLKESKSEVVTNHFMRDCLGWMWVIWN